MTALIAPSHPPLGQGQVLVEPCDLAHGDLGRDLTQRTTVGPLAAVRRRAAPGHLPGRARQPKVRTRSVR